MMSVLKLIVHIYSWFFSAHVTALCVMGDHKYYPSFHRNDGSTFFQPLTYGEMKGSQGEEEKKESSCPFRL